MNDLVEVLVPKGIGSEFQLKNIVHDLRFVLMSWYFEGRMVFERLIIKVLLKVIGDERRNVVLHILPYLGSMILYVFMS